MEKNNKMKIREATKRDLNQIAELLNEYTKYEHSLDKKIRVESLKELKKEETKHFSEGAIYFIAEEKGNAIGCLNANIDRRGKSKIGVIHNLIITKNARGKGYGDELVKYVFNYFKKKGCKRVKTFIFLKNKKAKDFWSKKGFNLDLGYSGSVILK